MNGLVRFLTCWCGSSRSLVRTTDEEPTYVCEEDSHRTAGAVRECSATDPEFTTPVGI